MTLNLVTNQVRGWEQKAHLSDFRFIFGFYQKKYDQTPGKTMCQIGWLSEGRKSIALFWNFNSLTWKVGGAKPFYIEFDPFFWAPCGLSSRFLPVSLFKVLATSQHYVVFCSVIDQHRGTNWTFLNWTSFGTYNCYFTKWGTDFVPWWHQHYNWQSGKKDAKTDTNLDRHSNSIG